MAKPSLTGRAGPNNRSDAKPFRLLSEPGNLNSMAAKPERPKDPRLAYRISNTPQSLRDLLRNDSAILLENALIDTSTGEQLPIPSHLRAGNEPGSYIVQANQAIDATFRQRVTQAGAEIVAYIPNNALLVKASWGTARTLSGQPDMQAVVAFEPYFKLKSSLLKAAVEQLPLPEDAALNVLLFPQTRDAAVAELEALGDVIHEERSPFGTIVRVRPASNSLVAIAQMQAVQGIELARKRISANDISRETLEVGADTVVVDNYLGLTGSNVLVGVNDTGVDTNHPDLVARVLADTVISGVDSNGHGTHVAGIIAGDGSESATATNAIGSVLPPVRGQFRGKAPGSKIYAMNANLESGPASDVYLQEQTRKTNAFISNNSWHYYDSAEYDLAAASYDAAVRDALPGVRGSQPLLFVFSSGNRGAGDDEGLGGNPDSIDSPGTAKNVITVGATEQYRNVTNVTLKNCRTVIDGTNVTIVCETNTPWAGTTDHSNRIASFSSRGNVGVGIEGDAGRFKPDVVAPGTFIISTRTTTWDERDYYNPTNYHYNFREEQSVVAGDLNPYLTFIPDTAVQVEWLVTPSARNPGITNIPIYVRQPEPPTLDAYDFIRTNYVSMPPDHELAPKDAPWYYGVANPYEQEFLYNVSEVITTTNDEGNYFEVLSNMNNQLGPYYRYESGTSMSAAQVSGTLALMQEYFEMRLKVTNSPALMKALLINGARSVGDLYNLQVASTMNFQGWGQVNLTNSLQPSVSNRNATASSMLVFDQGETNALSTGGAHTRKIKVAYKAITTPLRFTLVWTDPPGNPLASTKLVNNLDLIVTNLDTGDVFYGNDIWPDNDFNVAWDTNTIPVVDVVNNVENVFLPPNLGTNYSVTVVGRRVNVNAVPTHTNDVVQDYVLVISSGNGDFADALTLQPPETPGFTTTPNVIVISNSFGADDVTGGALYQQRIGGNTPLLGMNLVALGDPTHPTNGMLTVGMTNQWNFYMITNEMAYTNAVFATFFPPTLSIPRMGVNEEFIDNATRVEADLDMYVSTNASITNLAPQALQNAFRSVSRQGTETFVLTNATEYGNVFYIAVKCESQQGSEYGFLGAFSRLPFSENGVLNTFPNPIAIPDGTPALPGVAQIFGIQPESYLVRRVVVTNTLTHEMMGDLMGNLNHNRDQVWLNNHAPASAVTNWSFIYDDTGEEDNSLHTDGPGSLTDFGGGNSAGQWIFTMLDSAITQIGTNELLQIYVEKQTPIEEGISRTISQGNCITEYVYVPDFATNLTITINLEQGDGPLRVEFCREGGTTCNTLTIQGPSPDSGTLTLNASSNPPLNPGLYRLNICNDGGNPAEIFIIGEFTYDYTGIRLTPFTSQAPVPITDDAVTFSTIHVPEDNRLISVEVGLRVDHPRVSDLVFHLTSPSGTRVLLSENRGGLTPSGMGTDSAVTTISRGPFEGTSGATAPGHTNVINTGPNGTLNITWGLTNAQMQVFYENTELWNSGPQAKGTGTKDLLPSGLAQEVTIVITRATDAKWGWGYTVANSFSQTNYTVFTDDTNKFTFGTNTMLLTPIKFVTPPYTIANYPGENLLYTNGIFYMPEDTLDLFETENALGDWKLEVWDNRAGATNPSPSLISWQLRFRFENQVPPPILLPPAVTVTTVVPAGKMTTFIVDVPWWAQYATNTVVRWDVPLEIWHNPNQPPVGDTATDTQLTLNGSDVVLSTTDTPPLEPGQRYYIGFKNTGDTPAALEFRVEFDTTPLLSDTPIPGILTQPTGRYFYYDVSDELTAVTFKLYNLVTNANLVISKQAYPDENVFQYQGINPGTNAENVIIRTNSQPVPLTPGRWYIGVIGQVTGPIPYTLEAVTYKSPIPAITKLENNTPITATNNVVDRPNDYYYFVVEPGSVEAHFKLDGNSEELKLVLRKGLPPPDNVSFDLESLQPGGDDLLVVKDTDTLPLTPGEWYVTVVNLSGVKGIYTITANQFSSYQAPPTTIVVFPPVITPASICLSWSSVPGHSYYVQGLTDLGSTNWTVVSPTINAVTDVTSHCIARPTPYTFFRVREGVAPAQGPTIGKAELTPSGGFTLQWTAPSSAQFKVEWTAGIGSGPWTAFTNVISSTTGQFSFTDDAPIAPRFYRLQQLP